METLKTGGVAIGGLAAEGDEGLIVRAGVPLAVERDLAREGPFFLRGLFVSGDDFLPDAALDVVVVIRSDDDQGFADGMDGDPSKHQTGECPGLPDRVRRHDHGVVVVDDVLDHLRLARPQLLTEHVADVAGGIMDVRVLGWVEQISEGLPRRGRSRSQAATVCLRPDKQAGGMTVQGFSG